MHTPGPWEIVWERDTDHEPPKRAESVGPVAADHDHWSGWTVCNEDDARLIAAAPDLLGVLKRVRAVLGPEHNYWSVIDHAVTLAEGE